MTVRRRTYASLLLTLTLLVLNVILFNLVISHWSGARVDFAQHGLGTEAEGEVHVAAGA